jgi:3-hydroxyethyl bacteriochlorophyllide a dehydrogenase
VAAGLPPPTVWELDPVRSEGARGYEVIGPDSDKRRDYRAVYDVSGDVRIIDKAMPHLAKGGEIVLAGFYADPLSFDFAPAFTREASVRAAAEWQRADMLAVRQLTDEGRLDLTGLITHRERAEHARGAYRTAFSDAACLKMVLDWKGCQ